MLKFKFEIIIFFMILIIYVLSLIFIFFDFSQHLKKCLLVFEFDFYTFFPKISHEIVLTSFVYSFFLLLIPFFCYSIAYIKFIFSTNYYLSYLFFPNKYKRYLKQMQTQVFDEENLDLDIDVSGSFYHGDLIMYNYPLILLTVLPCFLICLLYFDALEWDDLWMEEEDDAYIEKLEEDYGSFQASLFDEYYLKRPFAELDTYAYERSEKFVEGFQEESLEYVMEELSLEEETDYLDFLDSLSQTITDLIFIKLPKFFPVSIINFFKFQNTELAVKNLLIFLFYFPLLIFIILRYFYCFLKKLLKT